MPGVSSGGDVEADLVVWLEGDCVDELPEDVGA